MAQAAMAAKPINISRQINWASPVGVIGEHRSDSHTAVLETRRPGDPALWLEDLGIHSKPWFAGICHDVLFLKAAFDSGNKLFQGLERAHLPGRERRLNFPVFSFTHQQEFWLAMEGSTFGEVAIKLRCGRHLARTLLYGDSWEEGLADKKFAKLAAKQRPAAAAAAAAAPGRERTAKRSPPLAVNGSAAAAEQEGKQPAQKRARLSDGSAAPAGAAQQQQQQQQAEQRRDRSSSQEPPPPPPPQAPATAAVDAGAPGKPAPMISSDSEAEVPVLGRSKPVQSVGSPASSPEPRPADRQQRSLSRRSRVVSESDSDEDVPLAARQAAPAPGSARRKARPPVRDTTAAAAAGAGAQASLAGPSAAGAAAGAAGAAGPRPAEEPAVVWLKEAEFPRGSNNYPFYLKAGPMKKGYFTINKAANDALLDRYEGDVVLRDSASPSKSWTVGTNLKAGTQRYLTRCVEFSRGNHLQAHDVLWLQRAPQQPEGGLVLLFGVWRWGSKEAAEFSNKLGGGGKAGGKAADSAKPTAAAIKDSGC